MVWALADLPLPSRAGVAIAAVAPSAFKGTGTPSSPAVPLARGVPGCDEAQEGVVQPLSDSSAALRSTQSSAGTRPGSEITYITSHKAKGGGSMVQNWWGAAALVKLHISLFSIPNIIIRSAGERTNILLLGLGNRLGRGGRGHEHVLRPFEQVRNVHSLPGASG